MSQLPAKYTRTHTVEDKFLCTSTVEREALMMTVFLFFPIRIGRFHSGWWSCSKLPTAVRARLLTSSGLPCYSAILSASDTTVIPPLLPSLSPPVLPGHPLDPASPSCSCFTARLRWSVTKRRVHICSMLFNPSQVLGWRENHTGVMNSLLPKRTHPFSSCHERGGETYLSAFGIW